MNFSTVNALSAPPSKMFLVIDILSEFLTACEILLSISVDFASFPRKNSQKKEIRTQTPDNVNIQTSVSNNSEKKDQKKIFLITKIF